MNSTIKLWLILYFLILPFSQRSFAQDHTEENACKLILQNGLYKTYKIEKNQNFEQDLKSYFSGEEFSRAFREGDWGGKLDVIIDGVPLGIGINSSQSEFEEFQRKIRNATILNLTQSFYDYSSTIIPDVELAKVYSDCIKDSRLYGFKILKTVGEKEAYFVIEYLRYPQERAGMPIVTRFDVRGGSNVSKSFEIGDELMTETTISVDRNPEVDLVFVLETDRGAAFLRVPSDPSGFNKDFPVGTIIISYLNWTEFQAVTKNNASNPGANVWTARYSKWAPADGRQVPNSSFQNVTSQVSVPDLRGQFLRGLNQFDFDQSSQVSLDKKDPSDRVRGGYQADDFRSHKHNVIDKGHHHGLKSALIRDYVHPGGGEASGVPPDGFFMGKADISEDEVGGEETRPKNVAIYYYIRIN
jgi:hypothetical protein